jgi:hypothetical protein
MSTDLSIASVVWARWDGALKEPGPDRNRLLFALALGGDLRSHYVFFLHRVLDRMDQLLGDADIKQSLRWPFPNRTKASYWTAPSFNTIAVLALTISNSSALPILSSSSLVQIAAISTVSFG